MVQEGKILAFSTFQYIFTLQIPEKWGKIASKEYRLYFID